MRPRTLRRRGTFYHRRRSHWRLNLALGIIGVALAGVIVVDILAWPPAGSATDPAKRIATLAATHAPARNAAPVLGATTLALAASAPLATPPRPARSGSQVGGLALDAHRRDIDGGDARLGAPTVRDASATARAPVPTTPAGADSPAQSSDEVPF